MNCSLIITAYRLLEALNPMFFGHDVVTDLGIYS